MKNLKTISALSLAIALGLSAPTISTAQGKAKVSSWAIDGGHSSLNWVATWAGKNINGTFAIDSKSAQINFDPKNLAASNVSVNIYLANYATPSKEAQENLPLPDWLNLKAYPMANFSATGFKALGNNKYFADGILTFKGARYKLPLPFILNINGNGAIMDANVNIVRTNIKVGMESDPKAEYVGKNVAVKVHLQALKK